VRFGILTQYYPPEIGAPQRRLSDLARRISERGHDVTILTAMPNYPLGRIYPGYGGLWRRESLDGARVIRACIYPAQTAAMPRRLASYFSFVASSIATGAMFLPRLDYLMTESPPLFLGLAGYVLSRAKRARWIFNVSDLWPESAVRLGVIGDGAALRAAYALERFCYRKASLITGQSAEIIGDIRRRFPGVATYHLSNGVDTTQFLPEARDLQLHERMASGAQLVAMYAGLHGIAQGLECVLEAATLLRGEVPVRFVFVGDGPAKPGLVERARALGLDNVTFMDPVPSQAAPALLASADIALIPLKGQLPGAVPSKTYEAMASATPIVMAAAGEAAAILEAAQAGIAVAPGDAGAMAGAVRRLANDPELRSRCGANGRRAALATYDRRAIADRFITRLENDVACAASCSAPIRATARPGLE
jgi:colanic acid biosynthesis glycosyl transferase WcaI